MSHPLNQEANSERTMPSRAAFDAAARNQARLEILARSSQIFAAARLDYQTVLDTVAQLVSELVGDACDVRLLSPDGQWLQTVALYHPDPERLASLRAFYRAPSSAAQGASGRVVRTGQPVLIPVVEAEPAEGTLSPQGRKYLERFGMHSLLAVPLRGRDSVLGVLAMARDHAGSPYTLDDQTLLQDLADRAALAIENARLYQAEQLARHAAEQASERTTRLQEITAALVEAISLEQVVQVMMSQCVPAFGANAGAVVLIAGDGQTLETVAASGYEASALDGWRRFPLSVGAPIAEAVRSGHPVFVSSPEDLAAAYPAAAASAANSPARAWAAIPFVLEGQSMGALALSFHVP